MKRFHASCLVLALSFVLLNGCARTPVAANPAPAPATGETAPMPTQPPLVDTACTAPRTKMCTMDYNPVCATRDTGIRCITTPCPSSERKTFSNGCSACTDPKVSGWTMGACPAG